jgi:acyl-CoA synthetase (AMP-forming)/AMP-acid ligase II
MTGSPTRSFNLGDLLELVVDEVPDRAAVVIQGSGLTYAELDRRSNAVEHALRSHYSGDESAVAILSTNRVEWLDLLLGSLKAGVPLVNINFRYTADEIRNVLKDSRSKALIFEQAFSAEVSEATAEMDEPPDLYLLEDLSGVPALPASRRWSDLFTAQPTDRTAAARSGDDIYMLYTGGTTGQPKGVLWRHEDLFFAALGGGGGADAAAIVEPRELADRIAPYDSRMVTLVAPPLMHGSAQWTTLITWLGGGTVVLNDLPQFDPESLWRTVAEQRVSVISLVGDATARPLADVLSASGGEVDVSSLKAISSGGAVLSPAVKSQLTALLPGVRVVDSVGASETGNSGWSVGGEQRRFFLHEGMAVLGDDLRPLEAGSDQVGRLARSGHIPLGYLGDPEKTAATFVVDPVGVRWVIPGDLAIVESDGSISLLGRGSSCINSGGEKIFPEEVEEILKGHPDVYDALVVGTTDPRFGETVSAAIELRAGSIWDTDDLSAHCRRQLAGYKVPRRWKLVNRIVRNPAGKPDYGWAKSQFEQVSNSTGD